MIKKLLNFALLLCMLVLGAGNAWGEEVTLDFSAQGFENSQAIESITLDKNVSLTFDKGTNSNAPKYYTTGTAIRCYGGNTFTVTTTSGKITEISLTFGTSDGSNGITTSEGTFTSPTWTGEANTVTFTIGGTTGNRRLQAISVTYTAEGGEVEEKVSTTTSFGVDAQSAYTTNLGETFTAPTATVTGEGLTNASVTYTSSDETVATVDATTGAVTVVGAGTTTITASYAGNDSYAASSASYTLTVIPVFSSLEALAAAELASGTIVKVSFENVAIKNIFVTTPKNEGDPSFRNGIYFDIQKEDKDIEIYYQNVPETWEVGGTVSGTMTCPWKKYSGTWELAPDKDTWNWNNLTYAAPATEKETATITYGNAVKTLEVGKSNEYTLTTNSDGELTVTSSNSEVATATLSEGNVTISALKAGTTTITFTVAETETYKAAEKKYTLTVTAPTAAAKLPFVFDGGKADATSDKGMTQSGLGSDYSSSPKLKFDTTGDNLVINYASSAKTLEYTIKGNSFSGGTFDVLESADGSTYTTVKTYTEFTQGLTEKCELKAESRFVKFVYTNKDAGNVALGAIKISDSVELADPELAFSKANYIFTADAADKAVTAASTKGSTGTITYALTEGDADAFQIDKTTGKITCTTVGIYTLTASIEADDNFMSKTATATVTIETNEVTPIIEQKALVAKYGDKYYAMATDLSAVEVVVTDDNKIYAANGINENLAWTITTTGTTSTIVNGDGKYLTGNSKTSLSLGDDSFSWDIDDNENWYTTVGTTNRTFIYNESGVFKNYASSNAGAKGYSSFASAYEVIPPIKYTRIVTEGSYGTICLPYAVSEEGHTGADFYTISGIETNGTTLTLEAVTSLEAGKPYIFQATSNVVECIYNGEVATAPIEGVYLAGTFKPITAEVGWYVMQKQNGIVGFYEVGDTTPAIGANRAYMKPLDSSIKCFTFGNTDAVQAIEALTNGNAKIYDINGRQLQQLQKGINILNGHKVMVK